MKEPKFAKLFLQGLDQTPKWRWIAADTTDLEQLWLYLVPGTHRGGFYAEGSTQVDSDFCLLHKCDIRNN